MSTTLVTGANGYIAGHIVKKLLESGEIVIGSVRSFNKAANLIQLFPNEFKSGQLRFVEVDFNIAESIELIFKQFQNITSIIHPAQNFGKEAKTADELDKEIIQYTRKSLESLVNIVEKSDANIERFVYFSTSVAVRGPLYDHDHVFTEHDFAKLTHEEALKDWISSYTYAKVQAEKFILNHRSSKAIEYKIIVPPTVVGPPVHIWDDTESFDSNNRHLYDIFKGRVPTRGVEWYADVRNIAQGAVQASAKSKTPGIVNNRYVIVDGAENYWDAIPILLESFKSYNPGNWNELNNNGQKLNKHRKVAKRDLSITEKELELPKITFEKTIVDTLKLIVELEKSEI